MNEQAASGANREPCFAPQSTAIPAAAAKAASREAWRSDELLGDRTEVLILHNNDVYRLRRTRQGKLILHK
jgi:hemin uptake protein HemP